MVISLPTENATIRMRAWRALKACGAAVLRDGAYLLPQLGECRSTLDAIGADVRAGGGTAYVLSTDEPDSVQFSTLFDRSEDYSALLVQIADAHQALNAETRSEEHTSELQSLMRISYAVFCLKKKNNNPHKYIT